VAVNIAEGLEIETPGQIFGSGYDSELLIISVPIVTIRGLERLAALSDLRAKYASGEMAEKNLNVRVD